MGTDADEVIRDALREIRAQALAKRHHLADLLRQVNAVTAETARLDEAEDSLCRLLGLPTKSGRLDTLWNAPLLLGPPRDAGGARLTIKATEVIKGAAVQSRLGVGTPAVSASADTGGTTVRADGRAGSAARRRPRTTELVRAVLAEKPNEDVDIREIREVFHRRAWFPEGTKAPNAMVYQAVRRLADEDPFVRRTSKTTWCLHTPRVMVSADAHEGHDGQDAGAAASSALPQASSVSE